MSYNSKYTGAEIENLLDKVDKGNIDTFKLSLTVKTLKSNVGMEHSISLPISFIEALEKDNKVIIPYDDTQNSKGYYTITGHITSDDKLNFTLPINNGEILYCNNVQLNREFANLRGTDLRLINIDNKQEVLKSGINISTINNKSLLNGGNIEVGPIVTEIIPTGTMYLSAAFPMRWNNIYIIKNPIKNLTINYNATNLPDSVYAESSVIFKLSSIGEISIFNNSDILKWANGNNPLKDLQVGILYELSISATKIGDDYYYSGILVPFNG